MADIAILYATNTGNTKWVAETIQELLTPGRTDLINIMDCDAAVVQPYSTLLFGVPTYGIGKLQYDWKMFLPKLSFANLEDKTIAIFGLGDQQMYPDTFVDAMKTVQDVVIGAGGSPVGVWPINNFTFTSSLAVENSHFLGLVIDLDNGSKEEACDCLRTWLTQIGLMADAQ